AAPDPAPAGDPQRELAAGRVAQGDGAAQFEPVLWCERSQMIGSGTDVEKGARPAAARVAQAPVLHVPRRQALDGEGLAHRDHEAEIVLREPEATVHNDHHRARRGARWSAQLAVLLWVAAVGDALEGQRAGDCRPGPPTRCTRRACRERARTG